MKVFVEVAESPIGQILVAATEKGLAFVEFMERRDVFETWVSERFPGAPRARGGPAREATRALERYFAGDIHALGALVCDAAGTDFQKRVWLELRKIPAGETISYRELARRIGNTKAVRAVGGANAHNPIPLVVPCHRVIGASGELVGFASGLERKQWLLEHEGALAAKPPAQAALFASR